MIVSFIKKILNGGLCTKDNSDLPIKDICSSEVEEDNEEDYFNRVGYKVFDSLKRQDFKRGHVVSLNKGVYMTLDKSEVFLFVLSTASEHFGTDLMVVSFKDSEGNLLSDVTMENMNQDTTWTRKANKFYVKDIYSLNDYAVIMDLYESAQERYKNLILDDSYMGFYSCALPQSFSLFLLRFSRYLSCCIISERAPEVSEKR